MSVKTDATRVAVLTALRDAIDEEVRNLRDGTLRGLLDAREELGVKSIDVTLPDGTKVAAVTLTQPSARISVDSEEAFTRYVEQHYPDEVVTETKVRPAFRKQLLDRVADAGDNDVADVNTGEIVPGLTCYPAGKPTRFSLRFADTGRQDVLDAWQAGALAELDTPAPPALTEGGRA